MSEPQPIQMLLWCPECRGRHVDVGDFATKVHHTHACQHCGHVWRPAIVPTCGVQFLPGFRNLTPALSDEQLHYDERHPDFEYETTRGPRKGFDEYPPAGDGWERNTAMGRDGWERFDDREEAYWRRRRS